MRLVGDPDGIAALKQLVSEHRDYLKFLIAEARSASDHKAPFKAGDDRWELLLKLDSGDLEIRRAP